MTAPARRPQGPSPEVRDELIAASIRLTHQHVVFMGYRLGIDRHFRPRTLREVAGLMASARERARMLDHECYREAGWLERGS